MTLETDICIVGAGPVGLFAVFACGQLGMRCALVDALEEPGGQLTALYPEKPIYDIPSRPVVRADALVDDLMAQAAPYEPRFLFKETTEALVEHADGSFLLTTAGGREVRARALLLAAGAGAFGPNRPPLADIEAYEGHSVFYHVARRERFRDARIAIAGGGDSAVDWALSLAEVAASVTVVHRRERFRAAPDAVVRMRADPRISLRTPYQLAGLEGVPPKLQALQLSRIGGGTERLEADVLIALFGLASNLRPLAGWGLGGNGKTIPVDPITCETARSGVFAIGDVAAYPGKQKLILTGFAEASLAAHAAHARVFPGKPLHFEHSTTRGVPRQAAEAAMLTG
ncbi:NAD(P)/FAD-dependent oxidoreductase [Algihabitans albus]|uniref:NAD(P)/FAD-dependent oxidoreductase n=1 Tax=Algihabitans albus TaxID=2164067 RepID=UPI000E5CF15A|nr:NAD(P)/FAD-dependent oxidoreductase [Algihabitans albus]